MYRSLSFFLSFNTFYAENHNNNNNNNNNNKNPLTYQITTDLVAWVHGIAPIKSNENEINHDPQPRSL